MIDQIKLAAFQIALTKTIGHVPRGDLGDDEKISDAVATALRIANTAVAMWGDGEPADIADHFLEAEAEVEKLKGDMVDIAMTLNKTSEHQVADLLSELDQERDRLTAMTANAEALAEAATKSLKAEHERRKKLLPGAPASTYTDARIAEIETALATHAKLMEDR